jgi:hypothetical protein
MQQTPLDGTSFPVDAFVAVTPGFLGIGQPGTDAGAARRRGVRGVIFAGEYDRLRGEAEAVHREITRGRGL